MTLLEGLVALVITSLAALGFLGAFEQHARATHERAAWSEAVAWAESGMEAAKAGGVALAEANASPASGRERRISRTRWQGALDEITVRVQMPDGQVVTLRRLAPGVR